MLDDMLFIYFLSFVYRVKARGRARTLNGSGSKRTKETVGRVGETPTACMVER